MLLLVNKSLFDKTCFFKNNSVLKSTRETLKTDFFLEDA
jgi:hypothetical protein